MMDARGTPRVLDFGLAKFVEADPGQSISEPCLGTPAYASPEKSGRSFFQSDWWQCIPLPLSPKIGFGMNVAVFPA